MLIHHEDGSKLIVSLVKGAKISNTGKCFLIFKSPLTNRKGIVELTAEELSFILSAASKKLNTEKEEEILKKL